MNQALWKVALEKKLPLLAGILDKLQLYQARMMLDYKIRIVYGKNVGRSTRTTGYLMSCDPDTGEDFYLLAIRSGLKPRQEELTVIHEFAHWLVEEFFNGEGHGHGPKWVAILTALGYPREAKKFAWCAALPAEDQREKEKWAART